MTTAARAPRRAAVVIAVALIASMTGGIADAAGWTVTVGAAGTGEAQSVSLAPPTNITAACASSTTITVSWTTAPTAAGMVYQSDPSTGGTYAYQNYSTTGSWTTKGLKAGTYSFEVATAYTTTWIGPNSAPTATITISRSTCT